MSNVDHAEIAKFEALAHRWWDRESEFKPLHDINPLRVNWIDERVSLAGKKVLDVGCGGGILSEAEQWSGEVMSAVLATFIGTLAMWWLYFGTSSRDATNTITRSSDPGRIGAYFHYVHALLIAGIIATAVGNDLVMGHPGAEIGLAQGVVLIAGPLIYLLGSAMYKRVVYARVPRSHLYAAVALLALVPLLPHLHLLGAGWLTSAVLLVVGLLETRNPREQAAAPLG